MKRIISLILILVCLMSLSSCVLVPAYDSSELIRILQRSGYAIEEVDDADQEGISGYIFAHKKEEELVYIYCKDYLTTIAMYKYISSEIKIQISELETEIKEIELKLEYSNASSAEKGRYYEEYLDLTEELARWENYGYGHGINVVWVGTKQAIKDIRFGN